jgi:hypothetical protein
MIENCRTPRIGVWASRSSAFRLLRVNPKVQPVDPADDDDPGAQAGDEDEELAT